MTTGFASQCIPQYRLLTEAQITELHQESLDLLETTGVKVLDDEALRLLHDAGCRIRGHQIVTIPRQLVEASIQSAPSSIQMFNRNGKAAMSLEGRNVYFGMGTDLLQTWDLKTGDLRQSCLQDVIDAAIIGDYCEEIDFIASNAFPHEAPDHLAFILEFKALLEHSIKPIYFTADGPDDLTVMLDMAAEVAGGAEQLRHKPFLIHYAEPISPLIHTSKAVQKLFLCADKGIPLNYVPALISGASGPVTLAGAIVVANAEALSGLVLQQLRAQGAPMITGFSATPLDMRSATTVYGSPDERLTHSACCDLYHYYGLPVWGEAGCSDAKCLDEQAAMESMASILMAALDGCNLVHDVGYLGQGLIGSAASVVMCSEIISYVKRIMRGFELSPERIGLDIIHAVGPGGNFLTQDQTRNLFREEHWLPRSINREPPEIWQKNGGKRYSERVIERTLEILATHQPARLPDEVASRIDAILERATRKLCERTREV
ncbi:trimethylamine methyltransferase [candidate division KSB3 bacterium]|uniref:Trimethylamine methyltransferase n=1 Tax=candidate division KSB3 bacterium TaxID=2044937 RepID=A0A9D5JZC3_9BACT|nr:trimethylamine methyltransferase [candidate division KSB3 bacterium]MBD3326810.1 trimethylamine methyltransferase [candidate division KSB3 bacterium]